MLDMIMLHTDCCLGIMSTLIHNVQRVFPGALLHKLKEEHDTLNAILSSEDGVDTTGPLLAKASAYVEEVKGLLSRITDPALISFTC